MRRLATAFLAAAALSLLAGAFAGPAGAQEDPTTVAPVVVAQVNGFVDPVVVDFIERTIRDAEAEGAQAVILQTDTTRAVVSDERMAALAVRIRDAGIPVGIWVGPSGARLTGAPAHLLGVVAFSGMAPGSRVGRTGDPLPGVELSLGPATERLRTETVGADEAEELGVLRLPEGAPEQGTPTVGDLLVALDGFTWRGTELDTARTVQTADGPRREALPGAARFTQLGLTAQLMHTVASPPVAYLLLVIGMMLILFEFFTGGIGVAGVVGASSLVLGCYGAAALPTRWWAFGLLVVAVLAFAVDVQTGVPRFWTGVGVVSFVIGSLRLYEGITMSWITLLAGIGGVLLAVLAGMPAMVRTRFATPTIGREWLVGELGEAVVAVSPDGVVRVREALWRAHTNRATPIAAGDRVRVVAIEGTTLEVEPETGGARDYRERRSRS